MSIRYRVTDMNYIQHENLGGYHSHYWFRIAQSLKITADGSIERITQWAHADWENIVIFEITKTQSHEDYIEHLMKVTT